ncbi:hypothetical protein BH23VER1_BH23VER1_17680 [soil metagenome]
MLIDTHCHLASPRFRDELPDLVARAAEAGVTRIIAIGTTLEDSRQNIALAEQFAGTVFASVGIHPTDVQGEAGPDWIHQLRELAAHPAVVAIGETGTDHFHPPQNGLAIAAYREAQAEFFQAQLTLAADLGLPVVIHNRESFDTTAGLLAPFHGKVRTVCHCFTGSWENAAPLVAHGHLVSFTGIATFKNAPVIHACVRAAPAGTFMLETDAPYLAPVPYRGQRNEPAFVRHTAEQIAVLRGESLAELAAHTSRTAEEFFALPPLE